MKLDRPENPSRRNFFKSGAAAVTLTLAPGVTVMAFGGSPAAQAKPTPANAGV